MGGILADTGAQRFYPFDGVLILFPVNECRLIHRSKNSGQRQQSKKYCHHVIFTSFDLLKVYCSNMNGS